MVVLDVVQALLGVLREVGKVAATLGGGERVETILGLLRELPLHLFYINYNLFTKIVINVQTIAP